jgi:hypothetical protein
MSCWSGKFVLNDYMSVEEFKKIVLFNNQVLVLIKDFWALTPQN